MIWLNNYNSLQYTYSIQWDHAFNERDLLGLLLYIFLILHPYTYMYLFVFYFPLLKSIVLLVPFLKSTVPFLKSTVPFLKVRSSSVKAPAIWKHKCDNLWAKTPITKTNDLRQKRRKKSILNWVFRIWFRKKNSIGYSPLKTSVNCRLHIKKNINLNKYSYISMSKVALTGIPQGGALFYFLSICLYRN